jgi:hypothetical protein
VRTSRGILCILVVILLGLAVLLPVKPVLDLPAPAPVASAEDVAVDAQKLLIMT